MSSFGATSTPPVPEEALRYFRDKNLRVGFDHRDVWREEHVAAFTVAKAMTHDVLDTIRQAADASIAQGITFETFAKEIEPKLEKLGWWGRKSMVDPLTGELREVQLGSPRRLKTIYDTNLRVAHAAGRWERVQRTKREMPYLMYRLGPSRNHREKHAQWEGIILPVDHPWWDTHAPINGWGCRCYLRQISEKEAARRGGPSAPPSSRKVPWLNKRTGQIEMVTEGIDPGWDYNPGKERMRGPQTALGQSPTPPAPPPVAGAAPPPDPKKVVVYPEGVPPTYGASPVAPDGPFDQEEARQAADDIQTKNGVKLLKAQERLRRQFNNLLNDHGFINRDVTQPGLGPAVLAVAPALERLSIRGDHADSGRIRLSPTVFAALRRWLRNPQRDGYDEIGGLRTMVHECSHGCSPMPMRLYHGLGQKLEEVTNELAARAIVERLTGADESHYLGGYPTWIGATYEAIQTTLGLDLDEARRVSRQAAMGTRRTPSQVDSVEAFLELFVEGFGLATDDASRLSAAIVDALQRIKPWQI